MTRKFHLKFSIVFEALKIIKKNSDKFSFLLTLMRTNCNTMKLLFTFNFHLILVFFLHGQDFTLGKYTPITPDSIYLSKPQWDNSGKLLLITGEHNSGIYTIDLTSNTIHKISDKKGVGSKVTWSSDNSIVTVKNNKIESLNNTYKTKSTHPDTLVYVDIRKKQVMLTNSEQSFQKPITSKPALYYNVLISPNRKWAVAHLRSEIYLFDTEHKKDSIRVGTGIASSWSPDGKYLFYFLDESPDGHQISNSDLYVYSLKNKTTSRLTRTNDYFEMWPNVSPDGSKLIFSDGKTGIIYITKLKPVEP